MVWHPALLIDCEEEATWFWALLSENDEKHREFHLYLEMLARIFHAYHCPSRQWIRRAFRTSVAKLPFLRLCCFLFRFSFPPLPADSSFSVKRLLLQTSIFLSFSVSVCVFSSSGCCWISCRTRSYSGSATSLEWLVRSHSANL